MDNRSEWKGIEKKHVYHIIGKKGEGKGRYHNISEKRLCKSEARESWRKISTRDCVGVT